MTYPCEICGRQADYVDSAVPDPANSGPQGLMAYRRQFLCAPHGMERRRDNTARVACIHDHLDEDGICYQCGADCRGIGGGA